MPKLWKQICILVMVVTPVMAARGSGGIAPDHPASRVAVQLGPAVVSLTGPWQFRTGDDPRWAQPAFDDSGWQVLDLAPAAGSVDPGLGSSGYIPGWTAFGHAGYSGFAWYRLHVHLNSSGAAVALLMPTDIDDGYQIYVDGKVLGGFGDFSGRRPRTYYGQPKIFTLPQPLQAGAASDLVIALRFYMKPADLVEDPSPGGMHNAPQLGLAPVVQAYYQLQRHVLARTYDFYLLPIVVYLLAALAALTLFLLDRSQRVFLWLGAAAMLNVLYLAFVLTAILTTRIDDRLLILRPVLLSIVLWAWLLAWYTWLQLSKYRWLPRMISGLTALAVLLECLQHVFLGRTMYPFFAAEPLGLTGRAVHLLLSLLTLIILYLGIRNRGRDGWIAAPALLLLFITLYPEPLVWLHIPLIWFLFGVQVSTRLVAELGISLWVILLLLLRFQRSQRLQQQLQNEMRQAQQVQHTLLPDAPATLPGFRVESLYRPAAEVGGDFFQVLPSVDGGLLVIIGDVSGKGLRAAMLVSLIVGTLRTFAEQDLSLSELLQGMNRRLCGRMEGGFATCICARICPDGTMKLANAGHLSPYLNGDELEVPAGLPLGISLEVEYEEREYRIAPGGVLLFLTDGVVEARNRRGELFGFDRTRLLIREPLRKIVQVAQQFGQHDDITAVRILREPA